MGPIDDNVRTYRIPDSDRLQLSAGVSYRLNERFSFDVGYSFVAVEDMAIRAADAGGPDANGPFSGNADAHVSLHRRGDQDEAVKLGGATRRVHRSSRRWPDADRAAAGSAGPTRSACVEQYGIALQVRSARLSGQAPAARCALHCSAATP